MRLIVASLCFFIVKFVYSPSSTQNLENVLGSVASDDDRCNQLGSDVFSKGGNAADAAIVATFCNSIYNQQSTSFGGNGFATVYDEKSGREIFYNFRAALSSDVTIANLSNSCINQKALEENVFGSVPCVSKSSIAFPLILPGLEEISRNHGRLTMSDYSQILIDYITLDQKRIYILDRAVIAKKRLPLAVAEKMAANLNLNLQEFLETNNYDANPILDFLRELQRVGVRGLYSKDSDFMSDIMKNSFINDIDIAQNQVLVDRPMIFDFFGNKIITSPSPAGGIYLKMILQLYEYFMKLDQCRPFADRYNLLAHIFSQVSAYLRILDENNYDDLIKKAIDNIQSILIKPHNFDASKIPTISMSKIHGGTAHVSSVDSY